MKLFTPRAGQVLCAANQIAHDMGDEFIGTDHLLLGLLRNTSGPAGIILHNHDVTEAEILEGMGRPTVIIDFQI